MLSRPIRARFTQHLRIVLPVIALTAFIPAEVDAASKNYILNRVKTLTTQATTQAKNEDCYGANITMNQISFLENDNEFAWRRDQNTIQTLIRNARSTVDHYCFTNNALGIYERITAITDEAKTLANKDKCVEANSKLDQARKQASTVSADLKDYQLATNLVASSAAIVAYTCSEARVDQGGDIIGHAKQATAYAQSGQCGEAQNSFTIANNLLSQPTAGMTAGISRYLSQAKTALSESCGIGITPSDTVETQNYMNIQGSPTVKQAMPQPSQLPAAADGFTSVVQYTTRATELAKAGNCQGSLQSLAQAQYVAKNYTAQDTSLNFNTLIAFATNAYTQSCVGGSTITK